MTSTFKQKPLVVVSTVAAAVLAGGANAAWSTSGSGNASVQGCNRIGADARRRLGLDHRRSVPRRQRALKLKLTNPNSFAVRITAVTLTSGGSITSSSAACNTAGHGVTFTNQTGLAVDLAANAIDQVVTLAGSVLMSTSSANSCQGVTFTIPVDVTAASN